MISRLRCMKMRDDVMLAIGDCLVISLPLLLGSFGIYLRQPEHHKCNKKKKTESLKMLHVPISAATPLCVAPSSSPYPSVFISFNPRFSISSSVRS